MTSPEPIEQFWEHYLDSSKNDKHLGMILREIDPSSWKPDDQLFSHATRRRFGSRCVIEVATGYPISDTFLQSWMRTGPSNYYHEELWLRIILNCQRVDQVALFWQEWSRMERSTATDHAIWSMFNLLQMSYLVRTGEELLRNIQATIRYHADLWNSDQVTGTYPSTLRDRIRKAAICAVEYHLEYDKDESHRMTWAGYPLPTIEWILEQHPIRANQASWDLLNDPIISDPPTGLFLMQYTRDSAMQLWVAIDPPCSERARVVASRSYVTLTYLSDEPVQVVRINGVYLYMLERCYRFTSDPADPNYGFQINNDYLLPASIIEGYSQERALVEHGPGFQEQSMMIIPKIIDAAVKSNSICVKSARGRPRPVCQK